MYSVFSNRTNYNPCPVVMLPSHGRKKGKAPGQLESSLGEKLHGTAQNLRLTV